MTENGVDTTFTYNDWGRTISKQKTVGQTTYAAVYTYFAGDKLKRVVSDFPGEAGEVAFNYDGMGKRRNKLVENTDQTWYRWDAGWGLLAEYGGDGSWTVGTREMSYTLLGMSALADVAGTNPSTGTFRYYAQDHLGSMRALFDDDATLIGFADYEPYGTIRTGAGPVLPPGQTFTGKPLDIETGLYYFSYRYYSPMSARWMSRDIDGAADGPNAYAYLANRKGNKKYTLGMRGPGWLLEVVGFVECVISADKINDMKLKEVMRCLHPDHNACDSEETLNYCAVACTCIEHACNAYLGYLACYTVCTQVGIGER